MNAKRHALNLAPITDRIKDGTHDVRRRSVNGLTAAPGPWRGFSHESLSGVTGRPGAPSERVLVTEIRTGTGETSSWGLTVGLRSTEAILELDRTIPILEHQILQIIVSTEISWLDLQAVVIHVELSTSHGAAALERAETQRVTLAFLEEDAIKSAVLESLIQAFHDESLTVDLVVKLPTMEGDSSSAGTRSPSPRSGSLSKDDASQTSVMEPVSVPSHLLAPSLDILAARDEVGIQIQSLHVDFQSGPETRLCGYQDCINGLPADAPVVVLSPGYGQTTQAYIALAYHLAAAGFRVLRYDHRNHIGNSSGEMMEARLSSMKTDLAAVVDAAAHAWPGSPRIVLATSLSGRVALKLAATPTTNIHLLVLMTPILDLHATLSTVHQEDLIVTCLRNALQGSTNILGHALDGARFLDDAMKGGYADFSSTLHDARSLSIPTIMLAAECDAWVSPDDVRHLYGAIPHQAKALHIIPKAVHHLHEEPRNADAVYQELVQILCELFPSKLANNGALPFPPRKSIERQIRRERSRPHRSPHAVTCAAQPQPPGDDSHVAATQRAASETKLRTQEHKAVDRRTC